MSAQTESPLIIAHRGYSAQAPENTLAAFRLGWESGAHGVECDVHLTADGNVVCIHDEDTERVSGQKRIVVESNWEQLRQLDVGSWKGEKYSGEPIPLLKDAIAAGPPSLIWVVEIKCGPEIVEPMLEAIDSTGHDWSRMTVISFNQESLRALKATRPEVKAYWLSYLKEGDDGRFAPSVDAIVETVTALECDGFGGQSGRGITADLSQALRKVNLELNVWTVDDPDEARRLKALGVTSITTNDPALILASI